MLPLYESERMLSKLEKISLGESQYSHNPSTIFKGDTPLDTPLETPADGTEGATPRRALKPRWVWPNRPWEAPNSDVHDPNPPLEIGLPGMLYPNLSSSPRARAEARAALQAVTRPTALVEQIGRFDPRLGPVSRLSSPRTPRSSRGGSSSMSPRASMHEVHLPQMRF